jgi:hypothetical protein
VCIRNHDNTPVRGTNGNSLPRPSGRNGPYQFVGKATYARHPARHYTQGVESFAMPHGSREHNCFSHNWAWRRSNVDTAVDANREHPQAEACGSSRPVDPSTKSPWLIPGVSKPGKLHPCGRHEKMRITVARCRGSVARAKALVCKSPRLCPCDLKLYSFAPAPLFHQAKSFLATASLGHSRTSTCAILATMLNEGVQGRRVMWRSWDPPKTTCADEPRHKVLC